MKMVKIKREREEAQPNAAWTDPMVDALLKSRLQTTFKLFANSKDQKSIKKAWAKVVLDVNIVGKSHIDEKQAKNKFNNLKKVF
jgi:hypothetical protein